MKRMLAARIGLSFDANEKLTELSLNLPTHTEILSVSAKATDDKHVLSICFLTPEEAYNPDTKDNYHWWTDFHFSIVRCNYTEIAIENHQYIGNIDICDETYAVFYYKE